VAESEYWSRQVAESRAELAAEDLEKEQLAEIRRLRLVELDCSFLDLPHVFHRAARVYELVDLRSIIFAPASITAVLYILDPAHEDDHIRIFCNTLRGFQVDAHGRPVNGPDGNYVRLDDGP